MKSIQQLLVLSKNPHYTLNEEEQQRLDDFLSKTPAQVDHQNESLKKSSDKTPAIVKNKNIVETQHGEVSEI